MLNQVIEEGRLVKDADTRKVGDKRVSNFTIAVARDYKDDDGERPTDFFNVVAWNLPEWMVEKYINKGCCVSVVGRLQSTRYTDNNNIERFGTEILADKVYPIEFPKKEA